MIDNETVKSHSGGNITTTNLYSHHDINYDYKSSKISRNKQQNVSHNWSLDFTIIIQIQTGDPVTVATIESPSAPALVTMTKLAKCITMITGQS